MCHTRKKRPRKPGEPDKQQRARRARGRKRPRYRERGFAESSSAFALTQSGAKGSEPNPHPRIGKPSAHQASEHLRRKAARAGFRMEIPRPHGNCHRAVNRPELKRHSSNSRAIAPKILQTIWGKTLRSRSRIEQPYEPRKALERRSDRRKKSGIQRRHIRENVKARRIKRRAFTFNRNTSENNRSGCIMQKKNGERSCRKLPCLSPAIADT